MSNASSISIGICAHNEEETIGKLLEQVMAEDIPLKEVIVVVAGRDSTADIVAEKSETHEKIKLIYEEEREGQIAAQNKILSHATGEDILLLDGDGVIKEGSLEALYAKYQEGGKVVAGKEIPLTGESFVGRIIRSYGEIHNELCSSNPRFSTHIGIFPSRLLDSFPRIILDDAYIEHRARQEGMSVEYSENAVKYHNTPNKLRFFFHQQKKNWAGRFQVNQRGYTHSKPDNILAKAFLRRLKRSSLREAPYLFSLALIETSAYLTARCNQLTGNFPVKWWRPENNYYSKNDFTDSTI